MSAGRLFTERCILLPLEMREVAARITSEDFFLPHAGLGLVHHGPDHPGDLLSIYPLLMAAAEHPEDHVTGTWTVVRRADLEAIGSIGVKGRPDDQGAVDIGYGFVPASWGQGFATEATGEVCRALLAQEVDLGAPVRELLADTRVDNLASQTVLRRCGFQLVGERHDCHDGPQLHWRRQDQRLDPQSGRDAVR
ncbi:GNAT family N-acetyltransferase [Luteococcus peritonei]|uniref:GNAT family N-acetyltransferase n=1 Tax=Luteococcus peritonei TaxID=88874 RepID=A0ABW4RYX3_9ACTN